MRSGRPPPCRPTPWPRAIAPAPAIAPRRPQVRSRTPSRQSAHRRARTPATTASGGLRRAAAARRGCRHTPRPRTRPKRARPPRSPAPSRTGRAAPRRPRSASRCRSRHPSVPVEPVLSTVLSTTKDRPGHRRRGIANPRRFAPLAATALLALIAGIVIGARHVPAETRTVEAFAKAWERGDHAAMYALLSDAARRRTSFARLQRTYRQAAETHHAASGQGRARQRRQHASRSRSRPASSARCKGTLAIPTGRARGRRPGHRLARRARLSGPAPRREAQARDDAARARRRSRPATARRSPRGRSGRRSSARSRPTSPGNIGPAPPELAPRARGPRRARRVRRSG